MSTLQFSLFTILRSITGLQKPCVLNTVFSKGGDCKVEFLPLGKGKRFSGVSTVTRTQNISRAV